MRSRSPFGKSFLTATALLLSIVFAGCHQDHHPYHPSGDPYPVIRAIEVVEFDTLGTHLEIEVHLYDARTGHRLGCSGDHTGLRRVDEAGVLYRTRAHFVRSRGYHGRLEYDDVAGRDLFVRVYEDDHDGCPTEPGQADDFVGQSPVFPAEDLWDGLVLEFDDVYHLELGMSY